MSRPRVRRRAKREGEKFAPPTVTRRDVLRATVGLAGLQALGISPASAEAGRFRIGACDWSLGQRARTGALGVARQLGLDGVQVSMGSVDNDLQLRRPEVQRAYRDAAAAAGVRIGGVALDLLNQVPYKSDPRTEQWVSQLGRDRICEFHAKENGFLLGQGRIDFPGVRRALDDIGYGGWIQIEGAVPKGQPLLESHAQNVRFMRTHFS